MTPNRFSTRILAALKTTPSSASEGTGGSYQTTNSTYGAAIVIAALSLGSIPALAQDVPANDQAAESASDPSGQSPQSTGAVQNLVGNVADAFKAATEAVTSATNVENAQPPSSSQQSNPLIATGATVSTQSPTSPQTGSYLNCPLDKLRSSYESVLAEQTTEVIDVLMVENEVLRICGARQSQINGILALTESVEKVANELLAAKLTSVTTAWSEAEAQLYRAKQEEDLRNRHEAARIAAEAATLQRDAAAEQNASVSDQSVNSAPNTSAHECRPDYTVTAIFGAAGKNQAMIQSTDGAEYKVGAGDRLPFGVKVISIGQGLVTIELNGRRDVLAFDTSFERPSRGLLDEGFIVTTPAPAPAETNSSEFSYTTIKGQ